MAQPELTGQGKGRAVQLFGSDGAKWIAALIDGLGHFQVDVVASGLPADAATQTTLALVLTALQIIDGFADPQNLIFGYNDRVLEWAEDLTAATPYNDKRSGSPPADEIWIITIAHTKNRSRADNMAISAGNDGDGFVGAKTGSSTVAGEAMAWSGQIVLKEGDTMRFEFGASWLNDDIEWGMSGYKMKIA